MADASDGESMPDCILIVDDDPDIRRQTRVYLERETKYEVCGEAVDGLEAIEKAQALRPDLIILDMSMPRMNGLGAARVLRTLMHEVPIILFTMHAGAILLSQAQSAGISAIVCKTDGLDKLVKQVDALLQSA
jgi:DNA-binding NarL/FixJ family response regulator